MKNKPATEAGKCMNCETEDSQAPNTIPISNTYKVSVDPGVLDRKSFPILVMGESSDEEGVEVSAQENAEKLAVLRNNFMYYKEKLARSKRFEQEFLKQKSFIKEGVSLDNGLKTKGHLATGRFVISKKCSTRNTVASNVCIVEQKLRNAESGLHRFGAPGVLDNDEVEGVYVTINECSYSSDEINEHDEKVRREERKTIPKSIMRRFSSYPVPAALRVNGLGKYEACVFSNAEYLVIDRLEGEFDEMETWYNYYNTGVQAKLIPVSGATYVYYKVDQILAPVTKQILAALSRHFIEDYTGYYNDWCTDDNVFLQFGRRAGEVAPPGEVTDIELRGLPRADISSLHHTHFTAEEVWSVLTDEEKNRARKAWSLKKISTTTMMGGIMLWCASVSNDTVEKVEKAGLFSVSSISEFTKLGKSISVRAKSYQNIVMSDLRDVFELDVLVNRVTGEVDWKTEKKNRTQPCLTKIPYKTVYETARKLFSKYDPDREKYRRLDWKKYWGARWQWSASGSIHSQYAEDTEGLPKERELRNKFIALNIAEDVPIEHYLNRRPELHAWSSVKYEWGKQRAIYGSDMTSYVLTHFVFFNCEDTLPSDFPVGSKARPSYVSSRVRAVLRRATPWCVDFEDFNSQHSNSSMVAVLNAYLDVNHDRMSEEQKKAAKWVVESVLNTRVTDNMGLKETYKAKGTLMSGWRLTTFVNSVLNYIYTREMLGKETAVRRSVHNGDDVLLGVTNFKLVTSAVGQARSLGIRLQRSKCAFGGIAEFLRVDHVRGETGQYLTRNIATLMHSRIESKISLSVRDIVSSMESRFREFVQRGGSKDLVVRLRKKYYSRIAPEFKLTEAQLYTIKTSHAVVGGCSESRTAPVDVIIDYKKEGEVEGLPKHLPGVIAYARALKKQLELKVELPEVIARIYSATENAVKLVREQVSFNKPRDVMRYKRYKALYKAHKEVAETPTFGKAMLTGFLFDVLAAKSRSRTLIMILNNAKNPMDFLKVVT